MLSSGSPTPEKKAAVSEDATTLLTVAPDDYIKGKVGGQVTLVEYVDFECEACAAFFPLVKQLEKDFSNDLQIVIRYFPLPGHRNGMPAALAVEAAGQQGKFFEMHDLLYTEQKKWGEKPTPTPEVFEAYAQQLGLDMEKFKVAVNSPETKARVERDIESGKALGNTGTPSFYLNGKKLQPNSYDEFKKAVQAEIDASKVEFGV
jgi:protein-disulfide isomerase